MTRIKLLREFCNMAASMFSAVILACGCTESEPANLKQPIDDTASHPPVSPDANQGGEPRYIRNKIKWNTASEDRVFGYFLVRADSPDGPFTRVNPRPIPAAGTTDDSQTYEITDERAVPARRYYYKIEALGFNNRTRDFSPIFPYQTPNS